VCAGSGPDTAVCCNGTCCPGCCGADGSCGVCTVFLTNAPGLNGNLGGLSGADATCQERAASVSPPLPGTYKAWLSDSTGSPATRFRRSGQPYVLPDAARTVVANDWTDLTKCAGPAISDPCLAHPINAFENGAPSPALLVWTNTTVQGTERLDTCNDWQSNAPALQGGKGEAGQRNEVWTESGSIDCIAPLALYCFQQS